MGHDYSHIRVQLGSGLGSEVMVVTSKIYFGTIISWVVMKRIFMKWFLASNCEKLWKKNFPGDISKKILFIYIFSQTFPLASTTKLTAFSISSSSNRDKEGIHPRASSTDVSSYKVKKKSKKKKEKRK